MVYKCRVCDTESNCLGIEKITGKDRISKLPGSFDYFQCPECNSWSIEYIPQDLAERYGKEYYSMIWKEGDLITPHKTYRAQSLIDKYGLNERSSILEWGGGTLEGIMAMHGKGIGEKGKENKLRCYEPYAVETDINGIKIQNKPPTDMKFDFIFSIHSLEHTECITDTLTSMVNCLNDKGIIYIEVPVSDCFTQSFYGSYSAQLDPPRHLQLPTYKGLKMACDNLGLTISNRVDIGGEFGLYVSSQYLKGKDYNTSCGMLKKEKDEVRLMYSYVAQYFNQIGLGDQIAIDIRK